jgi:hypothetical protein
MWVEARPQHNNETAVSERPKEHNDALPVDGLPPGRQQEHRVRLKDRLRDIKTELS